MPLARDSRLGTRQRRARGLESRAATVVAILLVPRLLAGQDVDANGLRLFEAGKFREAKTVFEPAFKANARDASAAFYLGRIALEERKHDRAIDYFEAATKLDPKNSAYFLWLGRALGREAQRANVLRQPGLAKRTKAAWQRAIELDPENLDARADLIQYYVQAPGFLGGSTEKALEQAEEIRKRNALRGYLELGALHEREKRYADAEQAYLGAAAEPSDRHVGKYRLGVFYQNTGAFEKAFDLFEAMLAADSLEHGALFQIGKTGAMSGQRLARATEALQAYLKTTPGRNDPSLAAAHWRLGMIHERLQDEPRARAEYETALRLDPTFKPATESLKKLT
ncbi:MAG TPA: tetratricopeptide repeat protein [Gemmatimonadaceae bacterium]|jgi:tetratricopeptide (TPR) repeat protein|nr:tetratricopeptide repeat protein [Gemmatimonadaceae bacterium]